jgi:hypothetical protein
MHHSQNTPGLITRGEKGMQIPAPAAARNELAAGSILEKEDFS